MTFGQTIKSLRREANMTQENLAELLSRSSLELLQELSKKYGKGNRPLNKVDSLCHADCRRKGCRIDEAPADMV